MINLGLARISRLLADTRLTWRAIHVAGTNGKGSVCAYASAMLRAASIAHGRFTSPHLIDRWDGITINEKTVDKSRFLEIEEEIKRRNRFLAIGASEFELLTATAFTLFTREKVSLAVVEVGLGGTEDATNVLQDPLATVITSISRDHESYLGNTLTSIAEHKAGIVKPGAPCFIDGTNSPDVVEVVRRNAKNLGAGEVICVPQQTKEHERYIWSVLPEESFVPHQRTLVSLAYEAVRHALQADHNAHKVIDLLPAVRETVWPGRLQTLSIKGLTGRQESVLLDGAHNVASAEVLGSYVNSKYRLRNIPVTWIIAASSGKNIAEIMSRLIRPYDDVVAVQYGPVEGMPWLKAAETSEILSAAKEIGVQDQRLVTSTTVREALCMADQISNGRPVVIAGSLYLVSDVLRLLRETT
ncbi:MAG: hypothetical protein Q9191_000130 [Dirinaria sp. TL-2023a]